MLKNIHEKMSNPEMTMTEVSLTANLWTQYCNKFNLLVDTKPYDDIMLLFWDEFQNKYLFNDYEDFYNFMCKDLV